MPLLTWDFNWSLGRAESGTSYGTYLILRHAPGHWIACFTRIETDQHRRAARPIHPHEEIFTSMADAMRACQRHADHYKPDMSSRLKIVTPRPQ